MTSHTQWTEELDAKMQNLWTDSSLTLIDIAEHLGVTIHVLKAHKTELALPQRVRGAGPNHWHKTEDAVLRDVMAGKVSLASALSRLPGRTDHACWSRMKLLRRHARTHTVALAQPLDPAPLPASERPPQVAPVKPQLPSLPIARARTCQYPLWANGARSDGRFCGEPVFRNSVCVEHFHRTRLVIREDAELA
jgi:hypothetical protein